MECLNKNCNANKGNKCSSASESFICSGRIEPQKSAMECINYDCKYNQNKSCIKQFENCVSWIKSNNTLKYLEKQLEYAKEERKKIQAEHEEIKRRINNLTANITLLSEHEENQVLKVIIKGLAELL